MLYTGVNHFNWQANSFSDGFFGGSGGTTLTGSTSAHVKGVDVALLSALAFDAYDLSICISNGNTDGTIRRQMIDILIDPAGGTSWTPLINNLLTNSPLLGTGAFGHEFHFPIFIPAGATVGARMQDLVAGSQVCRIGVRVRGQPTRPDLMKFGTKVQTIGATTVNTSGVSLTPGTASQGSYSASIGTLTNDAWYWQLGVGSGDTTMSANVYRFDIAHDATAKYLCAKGIKYAVTATTEYSTKDAFGEYPPILHAPAGTDVYVRGYCAGTPDSNFICAVYALS